MNTPQDIIELLEFVIGPEYREDELLKRINLNQTNSIQLKDGVRETDLEEIIKNWQAFDHLSNESSAADNKIAKEFYRKKLPETATENMIPPCSEEQVKIHLYLSEKEHFVVSKFINIIKSPDDRTHNIKNFLWEAEKGIELVSNYKKANHAYFSYASQSPLYNIDVSIFLIDQVDYLLFRIYNRCVRGLIKLHLQHEIKQSITDPDAHLSQFLNEYELNEDFLNTSGLNRVYNEHYEKCTKINNNQLKPTKTKQKLKPTDINSITEIISKRFEQTKISSSNPNSGFLNESEFSGMIELFRSFFEKYEEIYKEYEKQFDSNRRDEYISNNFSCINITCKIDKADKQFFRALLGHLPDDIKNAGYSINNRFFGTFLHPTLKPLWIITSAGIDIANFTSHFSRWRGDTIQ